MRFNDWRGRNIRLSRDGRTATRTESYHHGLTMTSDILLPNSLFQVCTFLNFKPLIIDYISICYY